MCAIVLAAVLPVIGRADVVFSDFGPGDTYSTGSSWFIGSVEVPTPTTYAVAVPFIASSDFLLDQIDLALTWSSGPDSVVVSLTNDLLGNPGSPIESWTISDLPNIFLFNGAIQTVSPTSAVTLLAGHEYWMEVAPSAVDTLADWNTVDQIGSLGISSNGGPFLIQDGFVPAFDVLGTSVPEPSSVWWLAFAFLGVIAFWNRSAGHSN